MDLISYQIDRSDQIVSVDGAWSVFARANGAPELAGDGVIGSLLWDHIADADTRWAYLEIVTRVRSDGASFSFRFRCDSPEVRRFMQMDVVTAGAGQVCFVCRLERTESRTPFRWQQAVGSKQDAVSMCSCCKRIEACGRWCELEEVTTLDALVEIAARPFAHGLCPDCVRRMSTAAKS